MTQESERPTLSFCAIVKNERLNLPRCLASVQPYVGEMIVVDTGSEDDTPEIAAQQGAKVSKFSWCDDFAAARNYAISQASGSWILMLDADEELVVKPQHFQNYLTSQPEILVYSLDLKDASDQEGLTVLQATRLFRNIPELRYAGRFHEQLKYQAQYVAGNLIRHLESLEILHYGYTQENLQQKSLIRIEILKRVQQAEGLNLMLLWTLSGMYECTQQIEKAQECYAEAFERLLPSLLEGSRPEDFRAVPSWIYSLGVRSLQQEDYETARLLCQRGLEWCFNYPPISYLSGLLIKTFGFPLGAIPYFQQCIQFGQEDSYFKGEPFDRSLITTYPAYEMGCIYRDLNLCQQAIAAFELALAFDANYLPARESLQKVRQI